METFITRFTYDTNRIEGSTLTLREAADLLEKGITPGTRPLSDVKEAETTGTYSANCWTTRKTFP